MDQKYPELYKFLTSQKLLTIATTDEQNLPWICNVYFSVDKEFNFFFFSKKTTKHGQHIERTPEVAFTTAWFNPEDDEDRKAIQAKGKCEVVKDPVLLLKLLKNHYEYFPDWRDQNKSLEDDVKELLNSRAYIIKPSYIKFWNDKLFGKKTIEEYEL